MKVKQFYTKAFSYQKIMLPFFITLLVMYVAMAILSMVGEQHWIICADAVISLGFIIAIYMCHHYNKHKAGRIITTFLFFSQAVFLAAYSFQPYPKSPSDAAGMIAFVFYILYTFTFFALAISAIVLHADLNKARNEQTLFAMQIIYTIQLAFGLILIIGTIVNFSIAGYSNMLMVDFLSYFAYAMVNWCLMVLATTMMPKLNKTK